MGATAAEPAEVSTGTVRTAAVGGSSGGGIGVLIVWALGYWHVALPAEVGAIIGVLLSGLGAAVTTYGIVGCCGRLIWGAHGKPRR